MNLTVIHGCLTRHVLLREFTRSLLNQNKRRLHSLTAKVAAGELAAYSPRRSVLVSSCNTGVNRLLINLNAVRHGSNFRGDAIPSGTRKSLNVAYFIKDEDWALKVMEAANLLDPCNDKSSILFLPNPGDSPLIKLLLEMTSSSLVTWEHRGSYQDYLQSITREFPGRHVNYENPLTKHRDFGATLHDHFSHLKGEKSIKLLGNITDLDTYIPNVMFLFFKNDGLLKVGNVPMLLFITEPEYTMMSDPDTFWVSKGSWRTSIYKLFFEMKHILTVPIEAYNRHITYTSKKSNTLYDKDRMYLVELRLRDEWLSPESKDKGLQIMRLMKAISVRKSQRAIPAMEKWCPDIGLRLMFHGVSMLDRIRDVPLSLWPTIYQELVTSKHFPYSPMKHILEGKEASLASAKKYLDGDDLDSSSTPFINATET